jgi:hypothetical protein
MKTSGGDNHKEWGTPCKSRGSICAIRALPRMERGYEKGSKKREVVSQKHTQDGNSSNYYRSIGECEWRRLFSINGLSK